jgi:transposase-like protein
MNHSLGEVPGNGKLINGSPARSLQTREPINHITGKAPDPETLERPKRRRYTAQFKKRILEELDSFTKPGQKGSLLRREGLYSSTVANWRKQRNEGNLASLKPQKRGPKSCKNPSEQKRIKELELENRMLQKKLDRANLLLDIQKKISQLTGIPLTMTENEEEDF